LGFIDNDQFIISNITDNEFLAWIVPCQTYGRVVSIYIGGLSIISMIVSADFGQPLVGLAGKERVHGNPLPLHFCRQRATPRNLGKYNYEIRNDQLFITKIEDPCAARGPVDISQSFVKMK
jgi:hypothetical protein